LMSKKCKRHILIVSLKLIFTDPSIRSSPHPQDAYLATNSRLSSYALSCSVLAGKFGMNMLNATIFWAIESSLSWSIPNRFLGILERSILDRLERSI